MEHEKCLEMIFCLHAHIVPILTLKRHPTVCFFWIAPKETYISRLLSIVARCGLHHWIEREKQFFSMSFLIFCCNLKFFYNNSSKNLEIFNNYGKEKKRTLCFAVFCLTMSLNHRKSMTVWKLCKNSSKRDVAGNCSLIHLEMAKVWRKKSLIEKNDHFNIFPMSNFCLFVFFNDAAQDCLSYLLSNIHEQIKELQVFFKMAPWTNF